LSHSRPKDSQVASKVRAAAAAGDYLITDHATERMVRAGLNEGHVLRVLAKGKHVPERDYFDQEFAAWRYHFEGETVDKVRLRIPVEIHESVLVVTVVAL
jgi:hypothetical protein